MSRLRSFTLELNPPSDFGPLRSLHEETVKQILNESDRMTRKACLDAKQKMHIVLLTEEMISVMPHLMEYGSGKFWIDSTDNAFELHIQVTPKDAAAQRRVKAPGAPRTFMARIIDIFGKAASRSNEDEGQASWSLESYIEKLKKQGTDKKSEEWDELEHSILANLADDVIVKKVNSDVELVIIKKVSPVEYQFT